MPPEIDWSAPWLAGWRGQALDLAWRGGEALPSVLNVAGVAQTLPVQFVPQTALPEGMAYEQFIFERQQVPTRENLHDFFNGLCWLRFPQAKQQLNRLQGADIDRQGVQQTRGPLRDALTLFDENAALLQAPEPLWQALLARDWQRLCVDLRPLWAQARLALFGHALLEKLVTPYKSITAHVYAVPVPLGLDADAAWDVWLAASLSAEGLRHKPFTPLPVLGVPGWWSANQNAGFYDDVGVFRPRRVPA
ncbi:MAG: DUF3025 domain-containing protein [Hydrogenophaga sp.]|nr:DUF3025 domain-containing protein [Hydrogenophaga sp.]